MHFLCCICSLLAKMSIITKFSQREQTKQWKPIKCCGFRVHGACTRRGDPPFVLWDVFLEGKDLQALLRPPFAQDVEQVGLTGLQRPARHLQVVVPQWNRFGLLPLVVEHVDGHLRAQTPRGRKRWVFFRFVISFYAIFLTRSVYGGRQVPDTIQAPIALANETSICMYRNEVKTLAHV